MIFSEIQIPFNFETQGERYYRYEADLFFQTGHNCNWTLLRHLSLLSTSLLLRWLLSAKLIKSVLNAYNEKLSPFLHRKSRHTFSRHLYQDKSRNELLKLVSTRFFQNFARDISQLVQKCDF